MESWEGMFLLPLCTGTMISVSSNIFGKDALKTIFILKVRLVFNE